MIEDYFLIMRIKRGDTDAFEVLVDKYYDQIFAYCLRRTFGNRSLAGDLTQDIFLKVIGAIQKYRYKGKFYNYLYTIAVNHCNSYIRKKQLEQVQLNENFLTNQAESIEESLFKKEESQLIQEALNQLPDPQREAIILRYYQNLKIADIAKVTGVGVATAQSRIHQALQKLARWLDKEEFDND
ncbi:RNA polymerase sigma factor [Streptococcus varani]|nr:RNA polymerase sigma factor [Streptococcus varani]